MNPEQVLREVAEQTMEALAYLLPMSEDDVELTGETSAAAVTFSGPFNGGLIMRVSTGMLDELAANMLGAGGEELTESQRFDGFKELLNVVCGNLLPRLAGDKAVFNVGAPLLLSGDEAPESLAGLDKHCQISMELDSGEAALELYLDAAARSEIGAC